MRKFKDVIIVVAALFSYSIICVMMASYIKLIGVTVGGIGLCIFVAISSAIPEYYLIKEYVNKD